ncbi:MAG: hypothetical protein L0099_07265 [Acidobacteria bacterium]|nr:hypothetical protein [Acidobacteriota bacterium]
MVDFVPGYDFDTDEIPTREKFLTQARGLQMVDLGIGDISSALVGIRSGNTGSSGYSLPGDSHVWVDLHGNVWVHEPTGVVQLYRSYGGWESKRLFVEANTGNFSIRPGRGLGAVFAANAKFEFIGRGSGASYQALTVLMRVLEQFEDDNTTSIYRGIIDETCFSGYVRWVGRGMCPTDNDSTTANMGASSASFDGVMDLQNNIRFYRVRGPSSLPVMWTRQNYNNTNHTGKLVQGLILAPLPAASQDTASGAIRWKGPMLGWFYGPWLWHRNV